MNISHDKELQKRIIALLKEETLFADILLSNEYALKSLIKADSEHIFMTYRGRFTFYQMYPQPNHEVHGYEELIQELEVYKETNDSMYLVGLSTKGKQYIIFINESFDKVLGALYQI
ncbi:hypothetical protein [Xanthocytophaga flava]|uniref:hypothetical protein n=1 Tax=Xanthocytophaga flava TaxID=3048013 RepID=UPI0028D8E940|nr:hypothetical protein [Xanthocytophaga flavus]MDJ1473169.1 hypothetical protein [Xanthocytophaga flavus]